MTTQWGRPLTGEQMKWARLRRDTPYSHLCGENWYDAAIVLELREFPSRSYRLPADHIAYKVLDHNEKHGTKFVAWYGGDSAPEDWDGGDVLLRSGQILSIGPSVLPDWPHATNGPLTESDIIGYTVSESVDCPACEPTPCYCATMAEDPNPVEPQPDTVAVPCMTGGEMKWARLPDGTHYQPYTVREEVTADVNDTSKIRPPEPPFTFCEFVLREGDTWFQDMQVGRPYMIKGYRIAPLEADTVAVPRMTEAEVVNLIKHYDHDIVCMLGCLGLIKPEPTREERFWAATGADKSAFTPVVLDLLNKALEF